MKYYAPLKQYGGNIMFNIDIRNKNVSEYHLSVINNNDVDVVQIFSSFVQYIDFNVYLKVESDDKSYVDKIAIPSDKKSIEEDALLVEWTMGEISTRFKKIYIQLQFENDSGLVAQSGIVAIVLNDTIDVDKELKRLYPNVLRDLERRIKALEEREGN